MMNKSMLENSTNPFEPMQFPGLVTEVLTLQQRLRKMPDEHKPEMIISFYKNHALQTDWVAANPLVARVFSSGSFRGAAIEATFVALAGNKQLCEHYERYLTQQFLA